MQERRYLAGEYIVRQGEEGASLFIVAEGLVNISLKDNHGQEKWLARIEPGRYFGEISLLTGQPRSASAQAATEVICYKITKEILEPIFQNQPELLEKISAIMADRQLQLCRVQAQADAEICAFEDPNNGHWFLHQMQRFFGIKLG
jgi:CRP-like cAMP-binding protein